MATSWLFTENGTVRPVINPAVRRADELPSVRVTERLGKTEIRFARSAVAPVALTSLIMWLSRRRDDLFVIAPDGEPTAQITRDRSHAIRVLSDVIDGSPSGPRFRKQRIVLQHARLYDRSSIAATILSASLPADEEVALLDTLFAGRFCIVRFDAERITCQVVSIGSSIAALDPAFEAHRTSRTFADMTDKSYGAWLSETFADYVDLARPVAESIFAEIHWPDVETMAWYERVIIPFERDGQKHALSITARDYVSVPSLQRGSRTVAQRPIPLEIKPELCAPRQ